MGERAVNREIGLLIPPDSATTLYFGCGDGSRAEALRQRYPLMTLFCVETDAALREQARQYGFFVAADAAELLEKIEQSKETPDAWIALQHAWQDETFTRSCRNRLFRRLRAGATLVWEIGSNQHWQYLLRLLAGKAAGEVRFNLEQMLAELRGAGVADIETMQTFAGNEQQFRRFADLLRPLLESLRWPLPRMEALLKADGFVLRGRYQAAQVSPINITAILGETQVCARVRIDEPHAFLSTLPQVACRRFEMQEEAAVPETGQQVWIWQRLLIPRERMLPLQQKRIDRRILTIQEWDDDPLHWEQYFQQSEFFALRSAHAIQTSTPALATYLRQFNPEVRIFPNCIATLPPLRWSPERQVVVFFGALNRKDDWKPILPALNRVLRDQGAKVRMIVVWDKEFYDAIDNKLKQFVPFCQYPRYQDLLRQSDIALLPMLPTRFNRMKSDLKFLECAAMGTVALASPTVYADTLKQDETGLLYETEAQFESRLTQLIEDMALRRRLAGNAWEWVKENRLLSLHYRDRLHWYQSLLVRYDELTEAIRQRAPEMRG
jgi:glycosyltransferase involved in cell wall biosynthesis